MTVYHVINSYRLEDGGAQHLVQGLNSGLNAYGVDSHLVGICDTPEEPAPNAATPLGARRLYSMASLWRLKSFLAAQLAPGDVVHAHLFPATLYVAALSRSGALQQPILMTEHSTRNRRRDTTWGKLLDAQVYRAYARIVAISHGTADALVNWQPATRPRLATIHNGIKADSPVSPAQNDPPCILMVGGLRTPKNHARALAALALVADQSWTCMIAGDGELRAELEARTAALGLTERVQFLGHVEDVNSLLRNADIFLMPSLWEGFGLAALEAMAAGLPLVVADIPGLGELVDSTERCAELVDPYSSQSIASGLRNLLSDPRTRRLMGGAAREQSRQFSRDSMVSAYVNEYARVLAAG